MFAYAAGRAGFPDHVILEAARNRGIAKVFTFDQDLARSEGAVLLKD